ncbi:squalene/phytoene synthase family protein [Streptomyces violaceusniger]|uniref:Phytoene synthase n=1 Tax=Streptomyces violaceusniger TaxID=68280 RepID=A0A4D4KU43_STRVO|nr:hypothetical protein SVIO_010390 [Streptomyces violaceusniger]
MGLWDRALDGAGISDPRLREDYTRQRKLVAGYRRSSYLAARLLLPPPLLPHVIAATALMHRTDSLLDSGPAAERAGACAEWVKEVRDGLAGGESDHAAVRPLLHTVSAHPGMRGRVEDFLDTTAMELEFLENARDTTAIRGLLAHLLGEARERLSTSRGLVGLAPPEGRPLFRAMIEIELLTITAAVTKGPGLLRAPARPPLPATARVLLRERRGARHLR